MTGVGSPQGGRAAFDPARLDAIDLVVFDKDGTLIDFDAMWAGWTTTFAGRLETALGRPVAGELYAALGFDPVGDRVRPGGPLAISTMAEIRELAGALARRWCPNVAAARRAVDAAWYEPDPVALARPLADLPALFGALAASGRRIAVATTDDRAPTEATLAALRVRDLVDGLACGDDPGPAKPDPAVLVRLSGTLGVPPVRSAVVGDTPADLTMARAAGAGLVVAVLSGIGRREDLVPLADVVLGSISELVVSHAP